MQDEWQPRPTTQVRLGGRGTYFSVGDRLHFTPRLSLSQALSDRVQIKAGGGVYRQHLQLITTEAFSGGDFWVPLDDTVEPGRSYQAVTGVEWAPSPRYQLAVDAYYTDLANLVTVDTELPDDNEETHSEAVFKSGGTGWASGVEVFLQRRTGALTGWIGYALAWTRRTFPELNDGQSLSPQARPPQRPVFCRLLQGRRMAARREPSVCHWTGIYTGFRITNPAQQRPPATLSPPRCQRQPFVRTTEN